MVKTIMLTNVFLVENLYIMFIVQDHDPVKNNHYNNMLNVDWFYLAFKLPLLYLESYCIATYSSNGLIYTSKYIKLSFMLSIHKSVLML